MINFTISALLISENANKINKENIKVYECKHANDPVDIKLFTLSKIQSYEELLYFLNSHKTIDCIITTPSTDENSVSIIKNATIEITKKWSTFSFEPNEDDISNLIVDTIKYNINRKDDNPPILFSFYTPTYNTSKENLDRLYESLCKQIYTSWNWYILDDSINDNVTKILEQYNDPRIFVFKNVSNHGNIGFNKHSIAMLCSGDWLLEVDHDDYVTEDCLQVIYNAIQKYPKSKFIYSDAIEKRLDEGCWYGEEYSFCEFLGIYREEILNDKKYIIPVVDGLNPYSIRSILAAPNHIRCFERNFYHKINGHSTSLPIIDDIELMSRAFLNIQYIDEITYIRKILYVQNNSDTTSSSNKDTVLSFDSIIYNKYDKLIHNKLLKMGLPDPRYDEEYDSTLYSSDEDIRKTNRCQMPLLCNIYTENNY